MTGENDARALEKNAAKAVRAIAERVIDIDDEWPVVLGTALRWFFEQSSFGAGVSPYIAPAFEEIPTATRVDRYAAAVAKDVVGQMARTYG